MRWFVFRTQPPANSGLYIVSDFVHKSIGILMYAKDTGRFFGDDEWGDGEATLGEEFLQNPTHWTYLPSIPTEISDVEIVNFMTFNDEDSFTEESNGDGDAD